MTDDGLTTADQTDVVATGLAPLVDPGAAAADENVLKMSTLVIAALLPVLVGFWTLQTPATRARKAPAALCGAPR